MASSEEAAHRPAYQVRVLPRQQPPPAEQEFRSVDVGQSAAQAVAAATASAVLLSLPPSRPGSASTCRTPPGDSPELGPRHPLAEGFRRESDAAAVLAELQMRRRRRWQGRALAYASIFFGTAAVVSAAWLPLGGVRRNGALETPGSTMLSLLVVLSLGTAAACLEHAPVSSASPSEDLNSDYYAECTSIAKVSKMAKLQSGGKGEGLCASICSRCSLDIRRKPKKRIPQPMAPVPPIAAPWAPPPHEPPSIWVVFVETIVFLYKLLVFIAFGSHVEQLRPLDQNAAVLAQASRTCVVVDSVVCGAMGLIFGHAGRCMPNVFRDDSIRGRRNPLSIHLMCFGTLVGVLGVGIRALRRGDPHLDECFATGLSAAPRMVALVTLDIPHLVLGSIFLFRSGPDVSTGEGSQADAAVGVSVVVAAAVGVAFAFKTYWIDVWWFSFGTSYRQRLKYLQKKVGTGKRWQAMQRLLRQTKHDRRLKAEGAERIVGVARSVSRPCARNTEDLGGLTSVVPGA
eukprot:gnl/TRDRNA2_/TRDRNA2_96297_c0_seq1.p1 gnl/TRDRNA2_/TRDRNA2_96297_c0~~gnl/TRDRNA2_/TRDRNA2_96297_c0_seq1.p1  ORF type:complete len:514 (+),score=47.04 gnl/TRDRNA2_/TRDRNA2_96297_c0_seq1:133-1674(+)